MEPLEKDVTRAKLDALLRHGETETLDYKETLDLASRRDILELAKDTGAMSVLGGYIVVGVRDADGPHVVVGLDEARARHFDEANVRQLLRKYLPDPLDIAVQQHEVEGLRLVLMYVGPHPAGCVLFKIAGEYEDEAKKKRVVFRKDEAFYRDGTSSRRLDQAGWERVRAIVIAQAAPSATGAVPGAPATTDEPESLDLENVLAGNDPEVLRRELFKCLYRAENLEAADSIFARIQELADVSEVPGIEAEYLAWRASFAGDLDASRRLDQLATEVEHADRANVLRLIGVVRQHLGQFTAAATAFGKAAEAAEDPDDRAFAVVSQAAALQEAGRGADGERAIESALAEEINSGAAEQLWRGLARVCKAEGHRDRHSFALMKAWELVPPDAELLFQAAYSLAQNSEPVFAPLVVHSYELVARAAPKHAYARNNLAVQLAAQEMPLAAVRSYRAAEALDNSLAMANLAFLLIKAGFEDEAEGLLTKAQGMDEVDARVSRALAQLADDREAEASKRHQLRTVGKRQAAFLSSYSDAMVARSGEDFSGRWKDGNAEFVVQVNNGTLVAEWATATGAKRKREGTVRGGTATVALSNMGYSSYLRSSYRREEREETGWEEVAREWCYLTADAIEVMRAVDEAVVFAKFTRVSAESSLP